MAGFVWFMVIRHMVHLAYIHESGQHTQCESNGVHPSLAILMAIVGHANTTQPLQLQLSIANKKAYAITHGFPMYLLTEALGTGQHPVWEKVKSPIVPLQGSRLSHSRISTNSKMVAIA